MHKLNKLDSAVRLSIYRYFIGRGNPPTASETATAMSLSLADVEASFRRLAEGHILVLFPGSARIWMAMPFSAVPTSFQVSSDKGSWWANCAWDALGIPVMLGVDAQISTLCADCDEPMSLTVKNDSLVETSGAIHFAVPAARWWDDIGFT